MRLISGKKTDPNLGEGFRERERLVPCRCQPKNDLACIIKERFWALDGVVVLNRGIKRNKNVINSVVFGGTGDSN